MVTITGLEHVFKIHLNKCSAQIIGAFLKYNRQQAIEKATELFWTQGFNGTKMRDLQIQLDMRPGSIYAGFGNKENLFKEAINFYVEQSIVNIDKVSDQAATPLQALQQFVRNQVFVDGCVKNCRICLLVKTLSETENSHPHLNILARKGLQQVEQKFADLFKQAQQQQLIKSNLDCRRLAKWLQMQIMGLLVYAKGFPNVEDLGTMIDDIFTSVQPLNLLVSSQ